MKKHFCKCILIFKFDISNIILVTFRNICRLLNVLHSPGSSAVPEVVIALDAEKAFDCVSWKYLFSVLEQFGFTEKSIISIRTLYSAPTARIRINGRLTDHIELERSTCWGCPLSSTLFTVYIKPLAQVRREDSAILGTVVNNKEQKIAFYADDVFNSLVRQWIWGKVEKM